MEFPENRLDGFLGLRLTITGRSIADAPLALQDVIATASEMFLGWLEVLIDEPDCPPDLYEAAFFQREATAIEHINHIGDLTVDESERIVAPALIGLLRIDRFLEHLMQGASAVALVKLWDDVGDAEVEVASRVTYRLFARDPAKLALSNAARNAAIARLEEDPKQKAKQQVEECWHLWQQRGGPYVSDTQFARDMLDKFPELTSEVVITRWARLWRQQSK